MRRRTFLTGGAGLIGAAGAAACTPTLGQFNFVAPKDSGGRRAVHNASYGPNRRQKLDVYGPTVMPIGMPIVMFFYGGSWNSGAKDDYEFLGDAIASRGFMTAIPDYRLVPQVRFPTFIEDCAAAVRWVVDHASAYGGDPSRIVLTGHSAGAYNATMLALDPRYLHAAGVDHRVIRGVVGLAGAYDFLPLDVDSTQQAFGRAADLAETQPIHFARHDAPPLLLMWGEKDTTVARRNIDSMQRAEETVGGHVETRIYPNVDHVGLMLALSRPFRGNGPILEDMADFVRRVTA